VISSPPAESGSGDDHCPSSTRGWVFDVLYAYQDDRSTPARLVLAGPGWYLLTGKQFRRLAEIIGARHDANDRPVRGIVRRLNRMADAQNIRSQPLDWSFRTDPQGLRKKLGPSRAVGDGGVIVRARATMRAAPGD
jgi:hypothetical protein